MLTAFQKLGWNRNCPRVWIESTRLQQLGFEAGTFLDVQFKANNTLHLIPVSHQTRNRVSHRPMSGLHCPIIDLNSRRLLRDFQGHTEIKLVASYKMMQVSPSVRSFHIRRHREQNLPLQAIEYFAGGSTLSGAITDDPRFKLVGAVEISPKFASHFALEHPDVPLYQCDIRDLDPSDLPPAAFMFASLPCTCFSTAGTTKKRLKQANETGDTGDLFLSFAHHVAAQMPLAVMVENVPTFFGESVIAGRVLMAHLERLGYHVHYFQVNPWDEWAEPQDRKRGVMVATLFSRFYPAIPMTPFLGTAGDYLDAPDPIRDREEAERIQNRIIGRERHMARHRAAGNHFGFSVINHQSPKVPTILRSYWKINAGPFVECEGGVRLLRIPEIERLMGFAPKKGFTSHSYSTAVEILGQGVQTRIFRQLVSQLGDFLEHMLRVEKIPAPPQHRLFN
jgi:DNA (cytosine-5)-methyltransferase 1